MGALNERAGELGYDREAVQMRGDASHSAGLAGSDYLHNADEDFYASDAFDDARFYGSRRPGGTSNTAPRGNLGPSGGTGGAGGRGPAERQRPAARRARARRQTATWARTATRPAGWRARPASGCARTATTAAWAARVTSDPTGTSEGAPAGGRGRPFARVASARASAVDCPFP